MNHELTRLAEQRRRLVAQAAGQRAALARELEPWRARLARVDQGVAAFRYVAHRPALIVGAVLLLAALRPRRAGKWLQRGWLAWQLGRRLR
jgi:YqjK-like protein